MFFALRKFGVLRERAHRRSKWFSAARTGNAAIIEALIEEGQDIDVQGPYGRTALHYACLNGHRAMAQSLLERGANPSIEEYVDYCRPLHLAVYHGYVDIVNALLEYGAEVNIENFVGRTPLDLVEVCLREDRKETLRELLLRAGGMPAVHSMPVPVARGIPFCEVDPAPTRDAVVTARFLPSDLSQPLLPLHQERSPPNMPTGITVLTPRGTRAPTTALPSPLSPARVLPPTQGRHEPAGPGTALMTLPPNMPGSRLLMRMFNGSLLEVDVPAMGATQNRVVVSLPGEDHDARADACSGSVDSLADSKAPNLPQWVRPTAGKPRWAIGVPLVTVDERVMEVVISENPEHASDLARVDSVAGWLRTAHGMPRRAARRLAADLVCKGYNTIEAAESAVLARLLQV